MQEKSDAELLREYAARASETAFREIVNRHADLVYASALRQARLPELSRDIAQTVFADLARRAPALGQTLAENASLVGWLYRSTRFEAHTQLRDDRRRQARERQAMEHYESPSQTTTEWERVGPVLDEAMADLSDEDRDALLLRFFKNHDFRAIGVALGVSDDAAQKRVSRALERLRAEFTRRGVSTTAGGLSAAVSAHAVSLAPAGLSATLSTAALTGTTLTTTATATAAKAIAMTTLQKTVIAVALSAAVGTGIYEARQVSSLRKQVQTLQQQQAPLVEQIQQLQRERNDATGKLAILNEEIAKAKTNSNELLRLRGEVGLLRRQLESQNLQASQQPTTQMKIRNRGAHAAGTYISKDQMAYAGYATPEAALETANWVLMKGTYEQVNEMFSPELLTDKGNDPQGREQFETMRNELEPLFKGMQIVAKKTLSDDKVEIKFKMDINSPGQPDFLVQPMVKVGDQWKLGGNTRDVPSDWEIDGLIQSFIP